jgi:dihydrofolate reductase
MRKIILSMQTSLDGFVEGENGDMGFFDIDSGDLWKDVFEMLNTVDTCILGRGMFEGYRDYWKGVLTRSDALADEVKYAKWAEKTEHILISKTIKDPQWKNTKVISGSSVADEIKKIKSGKGGDIYVVGGAQTARTVIDAGLVDEYRLTITPYIAKGGKSLFNPLKDQHPLELISSKATKAGGVILRYREKK